MAQSTCYEPLTDPRQLDPAVAWYSRHGSPDEKLKIWYYQGRIHQAFGQLNDAVTAYSHAESFADKVQDRHALGLLYSALQSVYENAFKRSKELEYAKKTYETFKQVDDPLTGPSLVLLAKAYQDQQKWSLADAMYQEALPFFEVVPSFAPRCLSDYAMMKVFQPEKDPEGAIVLLDRYRELVGTFTVKEEGNYAYALELLGKKEAADPFIADLRGKTGAEREWALIWLARIDEERGDFASAFREQGENYQYETERIQKTLEDSVTQALQDDAVRQAEAARERLRQTLVLAGGIFFALLSAVLISLLRKGRIRVERDRLIELREQMQEELEKVQEEKAEQAQLISGQEDRIREMEVNVARERDSFTRDRLNRLRQLGELRSTFWWRERGGMREVDAIRRIKKEFSYVFQTGKDGLTLFRHLDEELDGAVSRLRDALHLEDRPKEVLFLCCCILDLEPEMIAEIMDTSKANVYEKRSRLRARVRALGDPLLTVLVGKS